MSSVVCYGQAASSFMLLNFWYCQTLFPAAAPFNTHNLNMLESTEEILTCYWMNGTCWGLQTIFPNIPVHTGAKITEHSLRQSQAGHQAHPVTVLPPPQGGRTGLHAPGVITHAVSRHRHHISKDLFFFLISSSGVGQQAGPVKSCRKHFL